MKYWETHSTELRSVSEGLRGTIDMHTLSEKLVKHDSSGSSIDDIMNVAELNKRKDGTK